MTDNVEEEFSLDRYYMFLYTFTSTQQKLKVYKPFVLFPGFILFKFPCEFGDKYELVSNKKVLAVGDMAHGTIEVAGWNGKYRLLNKELFYEHYYKDRIELKG